MPVVETSPGSDTLVATVRPPTRPPLLRLVAITATIVVNGMLYVGSWDGIYAFGLPA